MNNTLAWIVLAAILIGGAYWYMQTPSSGERTGPGSESADMGTYAYQCEGGAEFTMTPSSDLSSITLAPGANAGFSATTLSFVNATNGQRFEGGGMVFVGAGESVALTMPAGDAPLNCEPKPNTEMAPWNWGDAGEGGGAKQDVALIVSESIVGKWQSNEDKKFVREFKSDGTAADWYDNKVVSPGTWKVFTKEQPLSVAFPLERDTVYIQMTMQGTQGDTLNFKLVKLTPEALELVYMDRGGALSFKHIQ
jgi:hypothetical protein